MTRASTGIIALALTALLACSGDTGPQGPEGPQGPDGPEGPIAAPPVITGISPDWGSALTTVTITGQNFSDTAADDHVTFNGVNATVTSATATQIVVQPSLATDDDMFLVVNVEVANQVSNGVVFELVASGTARALPVMLPSNPTSVVGIGNDLYIAAGAGLSPLAGLYKRDASGVVTQVLPARALPNLGTEGPQTLYDGPIALATDGTNLYYTTLLGSVRMYEIAGGEVKELLGPALGGGDAFPPRTALTFDSSGNLFVLDRNGNGSNNGSVIEVSASGAISAAGNVGASSWGLASDGTDLFATAGGFVVKIADPTGSPQVTTHSARSATAAGITVVGTDVVVSWDDGLLTKVPAATAGASTPFGDAAGYGYLAQGLWTSSGGDLYLAQSDSSAVREIATGQNDAEIVAAGVRAAFSTLRVGSDWYFATIGGALFGGSLGDAPAAPDAAILEVKADGSSRVVHTGQLLVDMVNDGSGQLTVSDCLEQRIFTLDVATGDTTDQLTDADGLTCPAGLFRASTGDLFYVNTDLGGVSTSTVGQLSGTTNTLDFVTGLPKGIIFLRGVGTTLVMAGLGLVNNPSPIYRATATASGDATPLVSAGVTGGTAGLSVGPNGLVYTLRFAIGDLLEIEPTSGEVTPVGSTLIDGLANFGPGGSGSVGLSIGFLDDGTKVMLDSGQGVMAGVAP